MDSSALLLCAIYGFRVPNYVNFRYRVIRDSRELVHRLCTANSNMQLWQNLPIRIV